MDTISILNIMLTISAALFGILCAIIGWVGKRIMMKQDELLDKLDGVKYELQNRINDIEIRLVIVETKVNKDGRTSFKERTRT